MQDREPVTRRSRVARLALVVDELTGVLGDDRLADGQHATLLGAVLVHGAVDVCGADAAGLMVAGHGGLRVVAAWPDAVRVVEAAAAVDRHGPGPDSYRTRHPTIGNAPTCGWSIRDRWPALASLAAGHGLAAAAAVPFGHQGRVSGALSLYNRPQSAAPDLRLAQALADITAAYLARVDLERRHNTRSQHLQQALDRRVVIAQTKGILAERWQVSPGRALHCQWPLP